MHEPERCCGAKPRSGHLTFRSLFIEEHLSRESAVKPYQTGGEYFIVARLNAYTWPASSGANAGGPSLPIEYVDNCWTRIAMSGTDVRAFLRLGSHVDQDAARLLMIVDDQKWYVLNEEEF